jgi:hypothetical protein
MGTARKEEAVVVVVVVGLICKDIFSLLVVDIQTVGRELC